MLRRLMAAAAVSIAVLIQFLADVTYVGFHILWNEQSFDKNMVYERIQVVAIYPQHSAAVHVHFVKKLAFLSVKVYFNNKIK